MTLARRYARALSCGQPYGQGPGAGRHYTGWHSEYYALRQARGLCPRCPREWAGPGLCPTCRRAMSQWKRQRAQQAAERRVA